jgi:hypothetical protein
MADEDIWAIEEKDDKNNQENGKVKQVVFKENNKLLKIIM